MSSAKKPFILRIDPQMLKAIEQWASNEFRSTNGQIEYMLREALKKASRLPKSDEPMSNQEN